MTKKSNLNESLSPIKSRISKQQKGDSPRENLPIEFLGAIQSAIFKGLWLFGNEKDFDIWMDRNHDFLIKRYSGTFFPRVRRFVFKNGGTLQLQVLNETKDLLIFKGQIYSYINVSGRINSEIQQEVLNYLKVVTVKKD